MSNNKNIVKYQGSLELNNIYIDCYVLEDGTRVLSGREMQRALNMVDEAEEGKQVSQTSGARLSRYLSQKTLEPFIYKGKDKGHFEPIECYLGEKKINGFEATVLIDICDAFLQARKEIKLSPRQKIIADQCEILVRSFAKVGLIALIDEATGYQYEREEKELQIILKALIKDELSTWNRIFELSFYKEIYRLWGVPFTPKNIRTKPSFIANITNRYVYLNLPQGGKVLKELKSKTGKTDKGHNKNKFHQWLTDNVGRETLKKVINTVESLASISDNKAEFERLIQKKYGQQSLQFPDFDPFKDEVKELPKLSEFNQNLDKALKFNPKEDKKPKE